MDTGILLADVTRKLSGKEQFDLILRQLEWGQKAGAKYFLLAQHWLYDEITHLQPVPLAARLAAELDPGVRVGTAVMVGPAYHPVALAEEVATLDIVTGGRFVLGIGVGYKPDELRNLGVDPKERGARLEEILGLLPKLWKPEPVSHEGRFYKFSGEPHIIPTTPGGPPVWVGAKTDKAVERAARLSDGWLTPSKIPFDGLERLCKLFKETRAKSGKGPGTLTSLRQIVPGRNVEDALSRHLAMSEARLNAYEARSLDLKPGNAAGETRDALQTALLGTPEQIVERGRWLKETCGFTTLITRVCWLGMTADQIRDEYSRLKEPFTALASV